MTLFIVEILEVGRAEPGTTEAVADRNIPQSHLVAQVGRGLFTHQWPMLKRTHTVLRQTDSMVAQATPI